MKSEIVSILVIFLLVNVAYAEETQKLRVTLDTPSVTFREIEVGDMVDGFVKVTNKNPFPVKVTFSSPNDVQVIFDGDTERELEPNDDYTLDYYVNVTRNGTYATGIPIVFSTDIDDVSPKSFTLSAMLKFVDVEGKPIDEGEESPTQPETHIGGGSSGRGGGSNIIPEEPTMPIVNLPEPETNTTTVEQEPESTIEPKPEQESVPETTPEPQETSKNNTIYWVYGFAVGLLIIAVIVYLVVKQKGKKEEANDEINRIMKE